MTGISDEASAPHRGVTVLGSANLDVTFTVERIPLPGETLLANSADRYPGGKGLNQAIAAARSGAATTFIGAVGSDDAGDILDRALRDAGVEGKLLRRESAGTGLAFIVVDRRGENTIVVASGANSSLTRLGDDDIRALEAAAVVLIQLELPLEVVESASRRAHAAGALVMLNAAPAKELPTALLADLDYLLVNEHEACLIAGLSDVVAASTRLALLVPRLVVTLGPAGSVLYDGGVEVSRIRAPRVAAVDTTGAGDTFCGAFSAAIAEGMGFESAARFATAAAALSVQVIGAVPSVPMRAAIEAALVEATP